MNGLIIVYRYNSYTIKMKRNTHTSNRKQENYKIWKLENYIKVTRDFLFVGIIYIEKQIKGSGG